RLGDAVAQDDPLLHLRAAQVQVAVAQADALVDVDVVFHGKGWRLDRAVDTQVLGPDLDLAGGDVGVDQLGLAPPPGAADGDHAFGAQLLGLLVRFRRAALTGREPQLDPAAAVPQVDEQQPAVVPRAGHPPGQDHLLAGVGGAQDAALVG